MFLQTEPVRCTYFARGFGFATNSGGAPHLFGGRVGDFFTNGFVSIVIGMHLFCLGRCGALIPFLAQ